MRPDGGADAKPDGPGVHAGAKNPPVPLRLQQSGGEDGGSVVFPPVLVQMLDRLESEILADRVSEESRRWLASCGLTQCGVPAGAGADARPAGK
ncbi:hypothetical protein FHB04_00615 [Escherichia coli]|nr:hypothetical protein [Escherichia coli]